MAARSRWVGGGHGNLKFPLGHCILECTTIDQFCSPPGSGWEWAPRGSLSTVGGRGQDWTPEKALEVCLPCWAPVHFLILVSQAENYSWAPPLCYVRVGAGPLPDGLLLCSQVTHFVRKPQHPVGSSQSCKRPENEIYYRDKSGKILPGVRSWGWCPSTEGGTGNQRVCVCEWKWGGRASCNSLQSALCSSLLKLNWLARFRSFRMSVWSCGPACCAILMRAV